VRRANAVLVILATAAMALPSCRPTREPEGDPKASPTPDGAGAQLTKADMEMFLAVRAKALTRLENEVVSAEEHGGSVLSHVAELSTAERDAVGSLGFDWRRYRWVREEVASLVAAQRQREDSNLLTLELTRARDDLLIQLKVAKDPASKQFLEAQVTSLDAQLEKLKAGRPLSIEEAQGLDLIAGARAALAVQQGRQDRIQRRVRELVQRERAGGTPAPTPPPKQEAK
jgi:hypothetical protein